MRPLTLASMAALNFGRTVPTTSSVAVRDLRSTVWARTAAGGRLSETGGATFSRQPANNDAANNTAKQAQLDTAADSLAPPERGEGWGEGI
jgi:hypothetical protein